MGFANGGCFDHLDAVCGQNRRHLQFGAWRSCLSSSALSLRAGGSCVCALRRQSRVPSRRLVMGIPSSAFLSPVARVLGRICSDIYFVRAGRLRRFSR